jgi:hypothetical protein
MERLIAALRANRYRYANEKELQDGIEQVLERNGVPFKREVRISAGDVVDFLVEGSIALEVKIDGGLSKVTRQLHRYAQQDRVREVLLVTTRWRHSNMPGLINGKPIRVLALLEGIA